MAVGNAGARWTPRGRLWVGDLQPVGAVIDLGVSGVSTVGGSAQMQGEVVHFRVDLGPGTASTRESGCDLTEQPDRGGRRQARPARQRPRATRTSR
jgi:N-acetylglutamate synthase/N-acetylornithine aminotransferase